MRHVTAAEAASNPKTSRSISSIDVEGAMRSVAWLRGIAVVVSMLNTFLAVSTASAQSQSQSILVGQCGPYAPPVSAPCNLAPTAWSHNLSIADLGFLGLGATINFQAVQ